MGITLLQMLLFCVENDFLLMLIDGCLANKDILLFHVQPLGVQ